MNDEHRADALARFQKDTADHQMEVLLDQGLHRHLRFRRPRTSCYGFDIVTWPGHLAISGDMGSHVFARLPDMFEFFRTDGDRGDGINPSYWAEKIESGREGVKEFNPEAFRDLVKELAAEHIESHSDGDGEKPRWAGALLDELTTMVAMLDDENVESAIRAMGDFKTELVGVAFSIAEPWEYASRLQRYTFHYLWRCYAIAHAVHTYDALKVSDTMVILGTKEAAEAFSESRIDPAPPENAERGASAPSPDPTENSAASARAED